jgi:lysophospholipase L1-like esterase
LIRFALEFWFAMTFIQKGNIPVRRTQEVVAKTICLANLAVVLLCCSAAGGQKSDVETTIDPQHPVVKPGEVVTVTGDTLTLSADKPVAWKGSALPSLLTGDPQNGIGRITEQGALLPKTLVVKFGDKTLVEGKDYLLDPVWGTLGIGPGSSLTPKDTVTASYQYAKLRLDSVVKEVNGSSRILTGISNITTPHAPDIAAGETRVANILVPYNSNGRDVQVFPILESPTQAITASTSGRIPQTMAKLKAEKNVKIVCWGDSLTAGGDASRPAKRYPAVFEQMLRTKFPQATIEVKAVAAGGSTSREWLYPDKFHYGGSLSWDMVAREKPDLVTVEFANDNYIDAPETIPAIYDDILNRIHALGAEVIFVTPSYFDFDYMKFKSFQDPDRRAHDLFLYNLTEQRHLGLADAAARWGHLWKEGVPYTTYLVNSVNHPDDRGHEFFAEELMKNFE